MNKYSVILSVIINITSLTTKVTLTIVAIGSISEHIIEKFLKQAGNVMLSEAVTELWWCKEDTKETQTESMNIIY